MLSSAIGVPGPLPSWVPVAVGPVLPCAYDAYRRSRLRLPLLVSSLGFLFLRLSVESFPPFELALPCFVACWFAAICTPVRVAL